MQRGRRVRRARCRENCSEEAGDEGPDGSVHPGLGQAGRVGLRLARLVLPWVRLVLPVEELDSVAEMKVICSLRPDEDGVLAESLGQQADRKFKAPFYVREDT